MLAPWNELGNFPSPSNFWDGLRKVDIKSSLSVGRILLVEAVWS